MHVNPDSAGSRNIVHGFHPDVFLNALFPVPFDGTGVVTLRFALGDRVDQANSRNKVFWLFSNVENSELTAFPNVSMNLRQGFQGIEFFSSLVGDLMLETIKRNRVWTADRTGGDWL